ncbi:acyl-CoA dehydrogenase [Ramlibacter sp. RBP-2]|uniref:3-sulfinopropanoyl-CoA desulfinase n=1 Tax=Ramlibacter lithotrophicus TaxID=2606681 RepID=A0A7X6I913_9BURK|nr:acyl-CoA dehydrogenase family protein [Ramlibacter lithotrophicus]NKE68901.1 acyl-CoA dehydrogenase [Ramlibacter lithotrophicus]
MILNEQQEMIRLAARDFAQRELTPNAARWDEQACFPAEAIRGLGRLGLMGINVPEEWGGAGADYVSMALALEEIARGDASTSTIVSGHNSVGCMPIYRFGSDAQRDRFLRPMARGDMLGAFLLTEAHGGSDAGAPKTTAVRRGDHYVLNGAKHFITSGKTAHVALVFAATGPRPGKDITAFIVPTNVPGYLVTRVERKLGQHASDTAQITFEDMQVPVELRLGEEGEGYRIALSNLEGGRIGIAAQAVGIAQAALDAALPYARERIVYGKPIVEHQAVGFRLAAMATRVETARQMVLHAAALKDAGRPCLQEACMAKLVASEAAEWVCSEAIQVLGGYGYLQDFPVERLYRDARVCRIYEGTNDIQHIVILRELLRRYDAAI